MQLITIPVLSTGQASCPTSPQVGPSVGWLHPLTPQYLCCLMVTICTAQCMTWTLYTMVSIQPYISTLLRPVRAGKLVYSTSCHSDKLANSAFHPSGVGKWGPASSGKEKAGMVHSVSGWTRGVQVKLWDPFRTCAIPERLRCAFITRRYINPRFPYLTSTD